MSSETGRLGRVATFNIHHGAPPKVQRASGRVARALDGASFDLVALQEVDRFAVRSGFSDQVAAFARDSGLHPCFAFTRAIHPGSQYGHALFTAEPLRAVEIVGLPRCGVERRVAIIAAVTIGGVEISVAAAHLHNSRAVALLQLEVVLERLRRRPGPHLLLGDLNLKPADAAGQFEAAGFGPLDQPSAFPSPNPTKAIDWIVASGLIVEDFEVIEDQSSDHRPVVASLRLPLEALRSL
ncbi:MAG: hypothetical protein GX868_03510 [Actinobacteria bacterium]|nr:hypothetical protein [Actinomycetota bacterium]